MRIHELLELVVPALGDRLLVSDADGSLTATGLGAGAARAGRWLAGRGDAHVLLLDTNSRAVPLALFGASRAGLPFTPLNYRLTDDRLAALLRRSVPAVAIVGDGVRERIGEIDGVTTVSRTDFLEAVEHGDAVDGTAGDASDVAVMLFTSGTTGEPKAAVLQHHHLSSYVLNTVEFAAAEPQEAALVSVPPYHVAGIAAVLSSAFAGRRIVYLDAFEPELWVSTAIAEAVTHAMVVPTMLGQILDELERRGSTAPDLRALSYGGGPMPLAVIERALEMLPHVAFVNAYGLTETASTVAILGPDDHREAIASDDPVVRRRLGSVGRPLPAVELTIRDAEGAEVAPGQRGEVWVRGAQVSGRYQTGAARPDSGRDGDDVTGDDGREDADWLRTRDAGEVDEAGFVYLHGRLDDIIVRGGENLSPGEIESVLMEHDAIEACAVVGIPDVRWGQRVVAVAVVRSGAVVDEAELQSLVRDRLRSTRTPERIQFRSDLPVSETGKLLRRVLRDELTALFG
ncbi:MAG: class I adenylate-forming enzyme family protein [Acidimicrobiales bacterium]